MLLRSLMELPGFEIVEIVELGAGDPRAKRLARSTACSNCSSFKTTAWAEQSRKARQDNPVSSGTCTLYKTLPVMPCCLIMNPQQL